MSNTAALSTTNPKRVTCKPHTVVLTLVDKDTEIIDDYQNYNSVYTFKDSKGTLITHKVKNVKLDLQMNQKTALTFIEGEIVAYKPNKSYTEPEELNILSHVYSVPNIFINFILCAFFMIPVINSLFYLSYSLFNKDDYAILDGVVVNTKYEYTLFPQTMYSALLSAIGSGLIFYEYIAVGVAINLVTALFFMYNSTRFERMTIAGKHELIDKIKTDLRGLKL